MPQLLIIADDLTGANDTGVQFAKRGFDVLVNIHCEQDLPARAPECQVLVVNTESRHLPPVEAAQRVFHVAQQGVQLGIPQFYKKTDSTLRGNIGAELAALLCATNESALYFAPAYPKLQRTTRNGFHYVSDIPLSQTSYAADALNPLQDDYLPTLIARQTDLPIAMFDAAVAPASQPTIYVVNAANEQDLQTAANTLQHQSVLAGSAGWAEYLLSSAATIIAAPHRLSLPLLVVNGSRHEVSLLQVAHAAAAGWPVLEVNANLSSAQISAVLMREQAAILTTPPRSHDVNFAARLAALVPPILKQTSLATLIVFGGDTLGAVAQACSWTTFHPVTEYLPGIPLVRLGEREKLVLLTKAGGFGFPDWLRNIF
ncbi:MAG TPA: four-carbon acid sugar kinase family protein [Blastocatellia bacterium]|nr:four-carbon acid sugar kinase family protein [Blastocatellia bacterium]